MNLNHHNFDADMLSLKYLGKIRRMRSGQQEYFQDSGLPREEMKTAFLSIWRFQVAFLLHWKDDRQCKNFLDLRLRASFLVTNKTAMENFTVKLNSSKVINDKEYSHEK